MKLFILSLTALFFCVACEDRQLAARPPEEASLNIKTFEGKVSKFEFATDDLAENDFPCEQAGLKSVKVNGPFRPFPNENRGLIKTTENKFLVAGTCHTSQLYRASIIQRFNEDSTVDRSYTPLVFSAPDASCGINLFSESKNQQEVLVGVFCDRYGLPQDEFTLYRLDKESKIDTSFGSDGKYSINTIDFEGFNYLQDGTAVIRYKSTKRESIAGKSRDTYYVHLDMKSGKELAREFVDGEAYDVYLKSYYYSSANVNLSQGTALEYKYAFNCRSWGGGLSGCGLRRITGYSAGILSFNDFLNRRSTELPLHTLGYLLAGDYTAMFDNEVYLSLSPGIKGGPLPEVNNTIAVVKYNRTADGFVADSGGNKQFEVAISRMPKEFSLIKHEEHLSPKFEKKVLNAFSWVINPSQPENVIHCTSILKRWGDKLITSCVEFSPEGRELEFILISLNKDMTMNKNFKDNGIWKSKDVLCPPSPNPDLKFRTSTVQVFQDQLRVDCDKKRYFLN